MTCRICGRAFCTESFHGIREQMQYEDIGHKLVRKEEFHNDEDEEWKERNDEGKA